MTEAPNPNWATIGWVVLGTLVALVTTEVALQRVSPPVLLREVEDAVGEYRDANPTVLAIGSSHGRTFSAVGDVLADRTAGREQLLAVPVEWGKLSSYAWVVDHRLRPLIEERDDDGTLVRPALRRVILVTEWWDSCPFEGPAPNLPARAWTAADFFGAVARDGLTSYNQNYLMYRWSRLLRRSVLIQDRGHGRILSDLQATLRGGGSERPPPSDYWIGEWQKMVEGGVACILHPEQMVALERMLTYFGHRNLDLTVLLYPRMPITLTDQAKATTLPTFARAIEALATVHGARFIDLTVGTPLTDDDFGEDFDHVGPEGNRRFAQWALDGELHFLLDGGP